MTLTKTAPRRSLMAGASTAAASLVAAGAMLAAPSAAQAADECTPLAPTLGNGSGPVSDDPSLNGSAPDTFNCTGTSFPSGVTYATDGSLTLNIVGNVRSTSGSLDGRAVRIDGDDAATVNVTGLLRGWVEAPGSGAKTIDIANQWRMYGDTVLGGGDDTVRVQNGGGLIASVDRDSNNYGGANIPLHSVSVDFGAGDDRLVNEGMLLVGTDWLQDRVGGTSTNQTEYELRLHNLDTFENAGLIMMGALSGFNPARGADRYNDDILVMPGATFRGVGDSRIILDVNLNETQSACDPASRDPTSLDLPAADCIAIQGGATEGVTRVVVQEIVPGDRGNFGEIVLVDVAGGTGAAGDFILDEASDSYSSANGGVIDKGLFVFPLIYDPATQQHKLVGVAGQNAQQFPLLAQAAHGLWRLSTGSWLDRQADLRGGVEDGYGGGVWMRLASEAAERDAVQSVDVMGTPFTFDNTHAQDSYTITGGLDVLSGAAGAGAWVLGLTAGYVHSDLTFEASPNEMRLDGWSGGGYASLLAGGFFIDAVVNTNKLEFEGDIPGLALTPAGTMVATNLLSVGGQVEAGWRLALMDSVFVEPLAGVSYVRTEYDDLVIAADDPLRPPLELEFDEPASLRANIGGRIGLDQTYGSVRAQFSVLGRVWNEFEGETQVTVRNIGDDAIVVDEFTGTFSEVGLLASVHGLDGVVSGFVSLGGKFGDDYQATSGALGVRLNW